MRIGIDIDGVLTDIERWQLDYGSKYFYNKHNINIKNYKGYETIDVFGVSRELDDEFWKTYFKDYAINVDARKFAGEVIGKLRKDGNQIYIIPARASFLSHSADVMTIEENKHIVIEWLKKNNICYDQIIFSPEDKLDICKENNIDLMIEDKPKNIEMISTYIPVICFHANYNDFCNGTNIYRCYSWYDILYKIRNLNSLASK